MTTEKHTSAEINSQNSSHSNNISGANITLLTKSFKFFLVITIKK